MSVDRERKLLEIPDLIAEKRQFEEAIIGQSTAIEAFAGLAARIRSGIRPRRSAPIGISFLAGPSGVGKTEIVNRLAEVLAGTANNDPDARSKVLVLNGGEYQEEHTISRVLGSPPGYVGSEDPRTPGSGAKLVFSQENLDAHKISYKGKDGKEQSVVLILVDEAEKANPALHRAFLSILDKGKLRLASNREVDFRSVMIFYTSNVGNDAVERFKAGQAGAHVEEADAKAKEIMREAFERAFPPEFRGRIEDLILFEPLRHPDLEKIAVLKLKEVEEDFWANGIDVHVEISPEAMVLLLERGYNPSEGARALNKVIKKDITDQLSLLERDELNRASIRIDVSEGTGEFVFYGGIDKGRPFRKQEKKSHSRVAPAETSKTDPESEEPYEDELIEPFVMPWQRVQVSGETIAERQSDPLRTALRQGVEQYQAQLDDMVSRREITVEQAGEDPRILEIAWDKILQAIDTDARTLTMAYGPKTQTVLEIEKLAGAGIGTYQGWSDLVQQYDNRKREEAYRNSPQYYADMYEEEGFGSKIKGFLRRIRGKDDY